uniref:endonuclease/exonuclease/phosphatase family protein n=1 Tax=Klebsiella pneumoniae TaxID=573 RepID=UPI003EBD2C9A
MQLLRLQNLFYIEIFNPKVNILQWNCRGIYANDVYLKSLVSDHNIDIVCLQETKLGNRNFNFGLNYSIYN